MTIPQPIDVKLTVKEAAATHVVLMSLIRVVEEDPERYRGEIDIQMLKRAVAALAGALTKAGCTLDDEGWRA